MYTYKKDEEIKSDIADHLYWDDRVDSRGIDIVVDNADVTLRGVVPNKQQRELAWDDASMIDGIRSVENQLAVHSGGVDQTIVDAQITDTILERLDMQQNVQPSAIGISVEQGVVHISGVVHHYGEKALLEDIARNTVGVMAVDNRVVVTPTEDYSDVAIAQKLSAAFERAAVYNDSLDVSVRDGIVKISGVVASAYQWQILMNIVRGTHGVKELQDDLTIQS